jgi:hypothetical protein
MLAGTIGSRPAGSEANARARTYLADQLGCSATRSACRRPTRGGRSSATRRASRTSSPRSRARAPRPSASSRTTTRATTRLGRPTTGSGWRCRWRPRACWRRATDRQWTLFILLTDAEEQGLMGAAGLTTDRDVMDRLRAYVNVEAIGSQPPVMLFEAGPGNAWLTGIWARHAPNPRGGSFGTEVYRTCRPTPTSRSSSATRSPGSTSRRPATATATTPIATFRTGCRGAPCGARARTSSRSCRRSTTVDITQRSGEQPTFFDVAGRAPSATGRSRRCSSRSARSLLGRSRVDEGLGRDAAPGRVLALAADVRLGARGSVVVVGRWSR